MAERGSVTLILGCMYSGKSSALQATLRTCIKGYKHKTCCIKHGLDVRYGTGSECVTHDGLTMPAKAAPTLSDADAWVQSEDFRVIGIDEGQFFDDLSEWCNRWADQGRIVIVAALNGDKNAAAWPAVAALIGSADNIEWHRAVCVECHHPATRSLARHSDSNIIHVGTDYDPVCRQCYLKNVHG